MNASKYKGLFLISYVFTILFGIILYEELRFSDRDDFLYFEIQGYDPKEIFRGSYVKLIHTDKNSKRVHNLYSIVENSKKFNKYQSLIVNFEIEEKNNINVLKIVDFSLKKNTTKIHTKIRANSKYFNFHYNLNSWYKETERAKEVERILTDRNSKFYLKTQYNDGKFRILDLLQIKKNGEKIIIN
jgi:uncharacterized membrane-anchored protein